MIPETGNPEINPKSVAYFSATKKCPSAHHVYHAIHHKLTTQKPRSATHFSQNTLQKRQTRRRKASAKKSSN
jgi:hypothetical protein